MSKIVHCMFGVSEAKGADGRTTVIASTASVDRHGDVIDQSTWQLDRHALNPVVLWAHNSWTPPVGKAEMSVEDGRLMAKITWDDDEKNELGRLVGHQFQAGFLSAVSVGFMPHTRTRRAELPKEHPAYGAEGYFLRDNELYELSAVPIPANQDALAQRGFGMALPQDAAGKQALLAELLADPDLMSAARRVLGANQPPPARGLFGLPKS